ncbi:hypothetical protein [Arthrobacter sp. TS-15]|nr:hypothetical protein [Arthrobacter sp. TS-15]
MATDYDEGCSAQQDRNSEPAGGALAQNDGAETLPNVWIEASGST